jgi:hypothetical protein
MTRPVRLKAQPEGPENVVVVEYDLYGTRHPVLYRFGCGTHEYLTESQHVRLTERVPAADVDLTGNAIKRREIDDGGDVRQRVTVQQTSELPNLFVAMPFLPVLEFPVQADGFVHFEIGKAVGAAGAQHHRVRA